MSRPRWLTPDAAVGSRYVYRRVRIPQEFVEHVNGALEELMLVENWEKLGDITPEQAATLMAVLWDDYVGSTYPMIGMIAWWAGALPANVLLCDGTMYDRIDYPDLYDMLDSAYIVDADHFKVPDMTDAFPLGEGTRAIGDTGGEETHTLTETEMPTHSHTDSGHGHVDTGHLHTEIAAVTTLINGGLEAPAAAAIPSPAVTGMASAAIAAGNANIQATGGDGAHNNMPPYLVNRWGIVAY